MVMLPTEGGGDATHLLCKISSYATVLQQSKTKSVGHFAQLVDVFVVKVLLRLLSVKYYIVFDVVGLFAIRSIFATILSLFACIPTAFVSHVYVLCSCLRLFRNYCDLVADNCIY